MMMLLIDDLVKGASIRRPSWPATDHAKLMTVEAGSEKLLYIFRGTDSLYHPWTLAQSDLDADDWVVVAEPVKQVARVVVGGAGESPRRVQ
jgi:hypothetical protein